MTSNLYPYHTWLRIEPDVSIHQSRCFVFISSYVQVQMEIKTFSENTYECFIARSHEGKHDQSRCVIEAFGSESWLCRQEVKMMVL